MFTFAQPIPRKTKSLLLPLTLFIFISAAAISSFPIQNAAALSGSQFNAGRIIDDAIFYNNTTMSAQQIQDFFNAKVPSCDTWGTQASGHAGYPTRASWGAANGNPAPYTCLSSYRQDIPAVINSGSDLCAGSITAGNKSAAEIIQQVSQACGVNPQVLIVLLQKEQGLVTDDWPWSTQYRSATGYGCPDTAPCDSEYYGFFNQVYQAAKAYKRYAANPANYNYRAGRNNSILYHPNTACGSANVYIETQATANLYIYTPYQPNQAALDNLYSTGDGCSSYGNRNYWRMFSDWFGATQGTVLLRGSGPTVYVRSNSSNKAYGVPSGEVLRAYGLEGIAVTAVSDNYLSSLDTSSMLTTLFRKPLDYTLYVADSGKAYGIASGDYCIKWALPCDTNSLIADLPYTITNRLQNAPPIGNVMQYDQTIFVMEAGRKRPFLNPSDKSTSQWALEGITNINSPLNAGQQGGNPFVTNSSFFKIQSSGAIYYYADGQFFTFSSFDNFKSWWNGQVVLFDKYSSYNQTPPSSSVLPSFVSNANGTFFLNGNTKLLLQNSPTKKSPLSTYSLPTLNALVNTKNQLNVDDNKAFGLPGGTIVTLRAGIVRPVASMTDLFIGFEPGNITNVSADFIDGYDVGKLYVAPGRVVKPLGGSTLYLYGSDDNLWLFPSMSEINSSLLWVNNVLEPTIDMINYGQVKSYSSLIKFDGAYYAVQANGAARELPNAILSIQKDSIAAPLGGGIAKRIAKSTTPIKFIHFANGTIFMIDGTKLRPIASFSTYSQNSGNPDNTIALPMGALEAFNLGEPL